MWNPRIHCRFDKLSPLVLILSQINPLHALQKHLRKIRFNIILWSSQRYSKWSVSLGFPHVNLASTYQRPNLPHSSQPPWSDHPDNFWYETQFMKSHTVQLSLVSSYLLPLKPIFLRTPVSNTTNLYCLLNVRRSSLTLSTTPGEVTILCPQL